MPDAVLPPGGRVLVVREVVNNPSVDVFDRQRFDGRVLDGHEDQTRKRVRRLGFRVHLSILKTILIYQDRRTECKTRL